jgi:hypothetical protein
VVGPWLGQRRFARHWSVGQLRAELADTYQIRLSADAIETDIHRYQQMLAARHQAPDQLATAYAAVEAVMLAIDGLPPEKGHETLYVVRELACKRIWFAEPLLSSATAEVQQLLAQARMWAERLGKPVRLWMSDKQDAFVRGIAAEFPGVPHRYCANHFLRAVAKPVLEAALRENSQGEPCAADGARAIGPQCHAYQGDLCGDALPPASRTPGEATRDYRRRSLHPGQCVLYPRPP